MIAVLVLALLQVPAAAAQAPLEPAPALPDSAALARIRTRLEGKREVRVRVDREWAELTRPELVGDTALAYANAFFDRFESQERAANPLPLSQVSAVQVKGKAVLPSVIGGSLSLGVSALASMLLTRAANSNSGIDGNELVRGTLIAFGAGAGVGALDGMLRTRWVTIWRRTEADGTDRGNDFRGVDGRHQNR